MYRYSGLPENLRNPPLRIRLILVMIFETLFTDTIDFGDDFSDDFGDDFS